MGRRILPKLDPRIDFRSHLAELSEIEAGSPLWTRPLAETTSQADATPAIPAEFEIEVGSGKGQFLLTQATARPAVYFLGCEIAKKYARYSAYRFAKAELNNVRMVRGDAQVLFEKFLPDQVVSAVHVYFPDPWWKAKHRKRRIVAPAFLLQVSRVLKPGGTFHFWTDVEEYFEEGCEFVRTTLPHFSPPIPEAPLRADPTVDFHTHYERRMLVNDHSVFRCKFHKPTP